MCPSPKNHFEQLFLFVQQTNTLRYAGRKAVKVVENVEWVIGTELLCACQAIEFHRPLKTTPALEAVYEVVRSVAALVYFFYFNVM